MSKVKSYLGINIDYDRDEILDDFGKALLQEKYFKGNEKSPQEAYARCAVAYSDGDMKLAQRMYDYVSKGWMVFATPVLSNAPFPDEKAVGLPISCFASFVDDHLKDIINHSTEVRWLSVKGGGVGGHWSKIRAVSDKSPSSIPFMKTMDSDMGAYKQGSTRRGSYCAYLDISHPDIVEFIRVRIPEGDTNRKCLNTGFHNAVNITDDFMEAVESDGDWDLKCPHTGEVRETHRARYLWELIMETRYRTGEPFICYIDTANRALPLPQKLLGLMLNGSNLCTEIFLATSAKRSFVCCLSSPNLERFDVWRNTDMIKDLVKFLDNVLQYFIDNAPEEFSKSVYSAIQERSIGIGRLGFHSYLQSRNVVFGSKESVDIVEDISKTILKSAHEASVQLGKERGYFPDYINSGLTDADDYDPRRNAHLLAIAPNANTAIYAGTSPSIEPYPANIYVHKTRIGSYVVKNKNLQRIFESKSSLLGLSGEEQVNWIEERWKEVLQNDGSVQNSEYLDAHEKEVFKTAMEINQIDIIKLGAIRQQYLCQGQSINIFLPAGVTAEELSKVHYLGWKWGLKSMYYLRTKSSSRGENVGTKVERNALRDHKEDFDDEECEACEG